jgi:hypothetical protein
MKEFDMFTAFLTALIFGFSAILPQANVPTEPAYKVLAQLPPEAAMFYFDGDGGFMWKTAHGENYNRYALPEADASEAEAALEFSANCYSVHRASGNIDCDVIITQPVYVPQVWDENLTVHVCFSTAHHVFCPEAYEWVTFSEDGTAIRTEFKSLHVVGDQLFAVDVQNRLIQIDLADFDPQDWAMSDE